MFSFRRRSPERRGHGRVADSEGPGLEAKIRIGDRTHLDGVVLDTSATGGRVRLLGSVSGLGVGDHVEVEFRRPGVAKTIQVRARVSNGQLDKQGFVVGLEFTNLSSFHRQLTPELWGLFNRRLFRRARVPVDGGPECELRAEGRPWHLSLHDLSAMGAGLGVDESTDAKLSTVRSVELHIGIGLEPANLTGRIVHRTPFGMTVRYGVVFDPASCTDFEWHQERIVDFLLSHRVEG